MKRLDSLRARGQEGAPSLPWLAGEKEPLIPWTGDSPILLATVEVSDAYPDILTTHHGLEKLGI